MPAVEESSAKDAGPHPLLVFLRSQPKKALSRLYQRPSLCLCIFRLLGPLERQIVMNILWLDASIPAPTMSSWVVREGKKQYEQALLELSRIDVLVNSATDLTLSATFKASLRQAITGGGSTGSFGVPLPGDSEHTTPSISTLDTYALEKWESILHYMVSSGTGLPSAKPSAGVEFLLERSGLMAKAREMSSSQITSSGFQFLLHTPHDQLWALLLQYLEMSEERKTDIVEVISFLFMLSTMELGEEYSVDALTKAQEHMLSDLRDYGLVWQRKATPRRYSPTRLATTLTSSLPPLPTATGAGGAGGSGGEGFIVLETNYRIYAYTDNPLQTAVLNLFINLKSRFPNLVVGSITRDSVKRALMNGITADQIISYLTTHAHPQMRKNKPLIPVTVQDQIRLWELEKNRVKSDEGYLYTSFASLADYEYVLKHGRELGVILWESAAKRCFFTSVEGHASIRLFIERSGQTQQGSRG